MPTRKLRLTSVSIQAGDRQSAKQARLLYTLDNRPGIQRRRRANLFEYVNRRGRLIRDKKILTRINLLAIPPAWVNVWICPLGNGHLQATGRDSRGRKQYRYHDRWRETRDRGKFDKLVAFAESLPRIRRRVAIDLRHRGLPREKVLAAVVKLLEATLIRVGNDEYAVSNQSYGLTTMRNRHVEVKGSEIRFRFQGKSGINHEIAIQNSELAKLVTQSRGLPGYELFQYVDDQGQICDVTSLDVNSYLSDISGEEITAKDFRTWAGTVLAASALQEFDSAPSDAANKRIIKQAIAWVAERLGNTPAVCRKSYVHPAIINAFLNGKLQTMPQVPRENPGLSVSGQLSSQEKIVLWLLKSERRRINH